MTIADWFFDNHNDVLECLPKNSNIQPFYKHGKSATATKLPDESIKIVLQQFSIALFKRWACGRDGLKTELSKLEQKKLKCSDL